MFPRDEIKSYGIVASRPEAERVDQVGAIVEKPDPVNEPPTRAVVGKCFQTPRVFHLEKAKPGAGGNLAYGWDRLAAGRRAGLAYRCDGGAL